MDTLCDEVCFFIEIQVFFISSIIPSFINSFSPHLFMQFDLFVEKDMVSMIGTKKDRDGELQDPTIP